jgi:hypothetical protein
VPLSLPAHSRSTRSASLSIGFSKRAMPAVTKHRDLDHRQMQRVAVIEGDSGYFESRWPRETTINLTKSLRVSARNFSAPCRSTNLVFPASTAFVPRQSCALSRPTAFRVVFRTPPHHSGAPRYHRSTPFNPHRSRVRRNHGRLPSSRCIESAPEHRAPSLFLRSCALPIQH